jgi:spore germination protein GerM
MTPRRVARMFITPFNVVALLLLGGVLVARDMLDRPNPPQIDPALLKDESPKAARVSAKLYFMKADASAFQVETRVIDVQNDSPGARAAASLAAWLEGPQGANAVLPAPRDSGVPSVVVRRNAAVVDLPRAWTSLQVGPEGEWRIVCGVALTLVTNSGVQDVQFLVGGETRDTLAGHVAIRAPFKGDTCGGTSAGR